MVQYRDRDALRLLVIGLAAIAAVSVAAATIESPRAIDNGQPGEFAIGDSPGIETPTNDGPLGELPAFVGETPAPGASIGDITSCVPFLAGGAGTVLYFGAFGGVLYGIKRRFSVGTALLSVYGVLPVALTAYFLTTACNTGGAGAAPGAPTAPSVPGAGGGPLAGVSPLWFAGALGVLAVGAAAVLYRATGDQTVDVSGAEDQDRSEDAPDPADLAAAAGAAADRLAEHDADADNEVYRAWYEMTSLLDVPAPETCTPGEFADAAADVGLNREDVDELTTLFEEVRYGGRDAGSREELALDVFRRIEAAYGDG